eukprot:GFKZ01000841.1.p1 GENE.GFKZ01000841.1~~GFKZ01000841.1.p1  ORF type:complete len:1158 (-),score=272.99 GFKZ01000841.1:2444-5917(-)
MASSSLDASLHAQIDTYIPEETPQDPPPPHPNDSIARDKQRLQRFHKEAMSFLSKAYSNDDSLLVEDRFDNPDSAARSADDFLAQRRIHLDRLRLERFHAHAVSFLDRAYANEPGTLVEEEALSPPSSSAAATHDKAMLQKFHQEAMSFLDAAAAAPTVSRHDSSPTVSSDPPPDRTSWRIERDKKRLEQHYQDAMSFLDRAQSDKKGLLVEEQELEPAYVDRIQLQRYAQEAMSFLDKAFRNDASVMVGDEDPAPAHLHAGGAPPEFRGEAAFLGVHAGEGVASSELDSLRRGGDVAQPDAVLDEEKQIAADRAALARYEEEFGDFLSKAYLDDSTVIVEDGGSETSGTERGLYARRMPQSTASHDTPHSGSATMDEFSEDAYTDDEFQDPPHAERARVESLRGAIQAESPRFYDPNPDSSGDGAADESHAALRGRMMQYEREAADYLDGANVSVDGEDDEDEEDHNGGHGSYSRPMADIAPPQRPHVNSRERNLRGGEQRHERRHEIVEEADDEDDEEFGADRHVEDETIPSGFYDDDPTTSDDKQSAPREFEAPATRFPDRQDMSHRDSHGVARDGDGFRSSGQNQDLLVDVILEDNTGRSREWSEVPLEKSFYRQVPRGSTIKLRPRMSPQLSSSSRTGSHGTKDSFGAISLSELQRVEKERDALMATLEEIVNERSMLAAQVSEMKNMITNAGGKGGEESKREEETEDIDLAAELREAHATMAKLTEEMEATLSVLDNRYQETLERAHKAEEKCIRLETRSARMEKDFSKQAIRLSQVLAEESRLKSLLSRSEKEMETLRRKTESDLKMIDDAHREELDRSVRKILDLTTEVSVLQEKVKIGGSKSAERRLNSPSRKLEMEVSGLRRRLADNERRFTEERTAHRKKLEFEAQKAQLERDREEQKFNAQIEKLQLELQAAEAGKKELRRNKIELTRMSDRADELERQVEQLKRELKDEKRGHLTAEAEAAHIRMRYEESLKKRMARIDQKTELIELQSALTHLKEEAGMREKRLQQQLSEFRLRAEQAETAAANAERDAKEAADVAKLAQERAKDLVESERKARRQAETERQIAALEWRKWEKIAQQRADTQAAKIESSSEDLTKSSSRRGLRKSPSKGGLKDGGRKKKDYGKGAPSGDGGKKKGSIRPRLFG